MQTVDIMDISPVRLVQNPGFGAHLLWTFGRSFQEECIGKTPQLPAFFLVLPLLLHYQSLEKIKSTNKSSGLTKLASKLGEEREQLIAIHDRAVTFRQLTLESLGLGVSTKILHIDYKLALVRSNDAAPPTAPERLKPHISGADKLGRWFSRLPLAQVFSLLQVYP